MAILFRGEAFRSKMKAHVNRRFANQVLGSETHVEFLLKGLHALGVIVDIYIHTFLSSEL